MCDLNLRLQWLHQHKGILLRRLWLGRGPGKIRGRATPHQHLNETGSRGGKGAWDKPQLSRAKAQEGEGRKVPNDAAKISPDPGNDDMHP